MKNPTLVSRMFCIAAALLIMAFAGCVSTMPSTAAAPSSERGTPAVNANESFSFNGYWKPPSGNILLIKERIYLFVNPDGSLNGGIGGISHTNRQFTLQWKKGTDGAAAFDYTVIDSGNIRVTPVKGNEWANGTWIKLSNVRGTAVNHRIIGYWEGRIDDNIRVLYFAGRDIVPSSDLRDFYGDYYNGQSTQPDGYFFNFDRNGNFTDAWIMYFNADRNTVQFMFDTAPQAFRFDGPDLIVSPLTWETNKPEIRYVRR